MNNYRVPQVKNPTHTKFFGVAPDGEESVLHVLKNGNGCELAVSNYGATVTSLKMINNRNQKVDVVLGFDFLENYIDSFNLPSSPYFGTAVGRFAGRINQGQFVLNGQKINLAKNNGNHHLHGGETGLSRVFWQVKAINYHQNPSITLQYISKSTEDFFPGELAVEVTYTLTENNEFKVSFFAKSTQDTVINLTHHAYFNLAGHAKSITNQKVSVSAQNILETTADLIPTGKFISLENHPFDFSTPKDCPISIDTTFVLDSTEAACLSCEETNLKMTVYTNQPAVHIYVGGNCFNQIPGKENANYHAKSGICFETQNFPDAPNHPHFPTAILKKDAIYTNETLFKFENLDGGFLNRQGKDLMAMSNRIPYSTK